ncbi:MAG TPA: hypothetical protein VNL35_04720 [Chloroflexota bacterium]|nr:hypothetical protein [Chloroflexota bacterium]
MTDIPHYTTLVAFGKERTQGITAPTIFAGLIDALASFVGLIDRPLNCRGRITGDLGRNIAPRKCLLNAKAITRWMEAIHQGAFNYIEIFDAPISNDQYPIVYAAIHKLDSSDLTWQIDIGAENCVIVAIRSQGTMTNIDDFEKHARTIVSSISGFYGSIEENVPWAQEKGGGSYLGDLIDMRWHDRTIIDYRNGMFRMDDVIPRLYLGNILSKAHFTKGDTEHIPSWAIAYLDRWIPDVFYVRFTEDPQIDLALSAQLQPYFNIIAG